MQLWVDRPLIFVENPVAQEDFGNPPGSPSVHPCSGDNCVCVIPTVALSFPQGCLPRLSSEPPPCPSVDFCGKSACSARSHLRPRLWSPPRHHRMKKVPSLPSRAAVVTAREAAVALVASVASAIVGRAVAVWVSASTAPCCSGSNRSAQNSKSKNLRPPSSTPRWTPTARNATAPHVPTGTHSPT